MNVITTDIESVKLIEPKVFSDDRGYFLETWNRKIFEDAGLDIQFVQDNESQSNKGTLRGIHFQLQHPQGKLVRAALGEVYDIAVDLRRDSPTFGHSVG
ncbi:MAG TPA: dTDP-4-keto-6-deoxy-D-glucose epimerase, partial [Gammaproteobacteria bacterium]|nr:dTDP-4-keto-6-deoxy-D-glucose epimerase [Gammaproteobacteria bacterium]